MMFFLVLITCELENLLVWREVTISQIHYGTLLVRAKLQRRDPLKLIQYKVGEALEEEQK